jgi:hypothetical protein
MKELVLIASGLRILFLLLSLRSIRWAYVGFVFLGVMYFPLKTGFRFDPQPCELTCGLSPAIHSLTNFAHIVMFGLFFVITSLQFRDWNWPVFMWAAALTLLMGAMVEIGEGVTHQGHCRLRDLISDSAGILLGSGIAPLLRTIWKPRPTWAFPWWRE